MISRDAKHHLLKLAKGFPAVIVQGPRQSGKTTLAKACFPEKAYVSLENPDQEFIAREDPRSFLKKYEDGVILDEIQRVPELIRYLQEIIDQTKECGRFILTGSTQLLLQEQVSQSLAGRAGILTLLPFSHAELVQAKLSSDILEETLFKGGYPPIYDRPVEPNDWLESYIAQYIEKDVRQLINIQNHHQFYLFVRTCASHVGQVIDFAKIGSQIGVDATTVKRWLSILQVSSICFLLQPYFKNYNKRIQKKPKLYFFDTGLVAHLLRIHQPEIILTHPYKGALFENWVISEWYKHRYNFGKYSDAYMWRDSNGVEIDLVIDDSQKPSFIELKSGATFAYDWLKHLLKFEAHGPLHLVYGGKEEMTIKNVNVQSWDSLDQLWETFK